VISEYSFRKKINICVESNFLRHVDLMKKIQINLIDISYITKSI